MAHVDPPHSDPARPEPQGPGRFTDTMKSGGTMILSAVTPRRTVVGLALAVLGLILWSEWNRDPVVDVAKAWNDSIERLGIRPVFPPQEDFHVGDVYAVLKLARPNDRDRLDPSQLPLVNKAIRVGHIDLLADILKNDAKRPQYGTARPPGAAAAGAAPAVGASASPTPAGREPALVVRTPGGADLPLRVMMFPGIRISVDQGLSFGGLLEKVTGYTQWTRAEQMVIDKPRTYGIEPEWAAAALLNYCRDKDQQLVLHCSEEHLRYLLSLQYGREACSRWTGGEPIFRIELFVVSRVYVSDLINGGITNVRTTVLGRDPQAAAPAAAGAPAEDEAGTPAAGEPAPAVAAPAGGARRHDLSASSTTGLRITQAGRLDAPAAFGFQATTIQAFPNPALRSNSCPDT